MELNTLLNLLSNLSPSGIGFKPHKHTLLLAVSKMIHDGAIDSPKIYFSNNLRQVFSAIFPSTALPSDRDRPWAPFFHLKTSGFWKLAAKKESIETLEATEKVGSPGELQRLVDYALLDEEVFWFLKEEKNREAIDAALRALVAAGNKQRSGQVSDTPVTSQRSLFAHEAHALALIEQHVRHQEIGESWANLDVYDPQSNRYFETDLVVVTRFKVFVIELKHWSGRIEVRANSWLQNNSFYKADPHKSNSFKAKLLRGLYEKKFPTFPEVFFESVVVLTNPDVEAVGCSSPKTSASNPTFESIDRFFQYLKHQRQDSPAKLTDGQCKDFIAYLKKLDVAAPPRDFAFPGYEIVERLYQFNDRAELVARRTDLRHRRLNRLRIFYLSAGDLGAREKAMATLNAVELIGEHRNILKVWDIPNENNYLVEGSDWSEEGTLRDCLERSGTLPLEEAVALSEGLALGLQAAHAQYVVHRGLCPENVLLINGVPKLMNFDLSFQLEEDRVTVIPDVTKLKRTAYLAPEIYTKNCTPEAAADLFSLGVVLYEMLAGERPFGCSTDLEQSGGSLPPKRIEKLAGLPSKLIQLIDCLIRFNPAARMQSAEEVISVLRECVGQAAPPVPAEINPRLADGDPYGLYRIIQFLCPGAESQIYEAAGPHDRRVALKLFHQDVPLVRVVDEQRFAGTVRHPGLVRVDSYGQWRDGRKFIAFHWISRRNLRQEITEGVRPDIETFHRSAQGLLHALSALHGNRENGVLSPILHNDIKPENILLLDGGMVLIDFGAASDPHVATYEGTEGYVAPDLRLGQDRDFCISGDLYALSVCLHEWFFGVRPAVGAAFRNDLPDPLRTWFAQGVAPDAETRFASVEEMHTLLEKALASPAPAPAWEATPIVSEEPIPADAGADAQVLPHPALVPPPAFATGSEADEGDPNPFVPYLNSLHSGSAASENALAESQALNPFFKFIHVRHPLAEEIEKVLTGSDRTHVILTGHAGDGKTTIAVEILKRLRGMKPDDPLTSHLKPREDIGEFALVKDFSEWSPAQRSNLLAEMLAPHGPRFLLVSNTGTLLDAFKEREAVHEGNVIGVESSLLKAMSSPKPESISFSETRFVLINIAMMDNLAIARQIFERMLVAERWAVCETAACREKCPIHQNVSLLQANQQIVLDRLFLAYRRLYEYGTRLTLRQLTGHLAYLITAGLDYAQIRSQATRAEPPHPSAHLFFNRFFGDDGKERDPITAKLRGIQAVRQQQFGTTLCPTWERRLWLRSRGATFHLQAHQAPQAFEALRACAAELRYDAELTAEDARTQVRRAVFFLHAFDEKDGDRFLTTFLRSNMLLDFVRWQQVDRGTLPLLESAELKRRIMHVLQEQFTGVRLPEGSSAEKQLLITLSRRSGDVRQSAQVVLASCRNDDFQVELREATNPAGGVRRELVLVETSDRQSLFLELPLPFLDYVMLRNFGEIGQTLQAAYVDRLERFKGQLIARAAVRKTDGITLVRLRTNHTFRRQVVSVQKGRLEVTDA